MIIPIGDRVLVKPNTPEDKSKGGILLTKEDDPKQDQGIVLSVGDGKGVQRFKAGDEIIYERFGPANVTIKKEKLIIAHLDEVLGIIKGELK